MALSTIAVEALRGYILEHSDQSALDISLEHNLSVTTVWKHAKAVGVQLNKTVYNKRLTPEALLARIRWIKAHPHLTLKKMADHFKITYQSAYAFVQVHGLSYKEDDGGAGRSLGTSRERVKGFNVHARQNWMI